jgi:hypothetical protein
MLSTNNICTFANVVIIDPTQVDLVYFISKGGHEMPTQANERFYHNQHFMNAFIFVAIEVFGCLHQ